jgi:hypothetical protein
MPAIRVDLRISHPPPVVIRLTVSHHATDPGVNLPRPAVGRVPVPADGADLYHAASRLGRLIPGQRGLEDDVTTGALWRTMNFQPEALGVYGNAARMGSERTRRPLTLRRCRGRA